MAACLFSWRAGAVAAVSTVLLLLAACDQKRAEKLEEGVSTESDVRREFGEPDATYTDADGSRTLEFARQPEGRTNYMITIGADGKMSALRQVLKPADFSKVTAGLDKSQVRRLLGRPAKVTPIELKKEEVWDWFWQDGQAMKVFSATFDANGVVSITAVTDDPRHATPN